MTLGFFPNYFNNSVIRVISFLYMPVNLENNNLHNTSGNHQKQKKCVYCLLQTTISLNIKIGWISLCFAQLQSLAQPPHSLAESCTDLALLVKHCACPVVLHKAVLHSRAPWPSTTLFQSTYSLAKQSTASVPCVNLTQLPWTFA